MGEQQHERESVRGKSGTGQESFREVRWKNVATLGKFRSPRWGKGDE